METQKIVNLLGDVDNESSKRTTRKWYFINDQNNTDYGEGNKSGTTVKFIKWNICDYLDAYILVAGDITATGGDVNTKNAFKNCAPFTKCITHINDEHVDGAENLDIVKPMYNLIEYSDNYSDTAGSLWIFKGDEQNMNNRNPANVTTVDSSSFKYKSSFLKTLEDPDNEVFKNVKIAIPLKYLNNCWRSLEMPLINCKIHLELKWTKHCVMSTIADRTSKIKNTKLYVPMLPYQARTM